MKSRSFIITGAVVAAIAMCGPVTAFAASKKPSPSPSPAASASPSAKGATSSTDKPARSIPFHGMVSAVDQNAKTFTIQGKEKARVFKITDKTTIKKSGADATFADITANEKVSGSYWKQSDGSLECRSVNVGGTSASATPAAKKSKKGDAATSSPAASPSASPKK